MRTLQVAPVIGEGLAVERTVEDLPALAEALARLLHLDAERVVLVLRGAATEPEMEVLLRQMRQRGDLAGEPERLVPGRHEDAGAEREVGEAPGDVTEYEQRARHREVVREVMLEHPGGAVPESAVALAVGEDLLVERGVVEARLADRCGDEAELDRRAHASNAFRTARPASRIASAA